MVVVDAPSDQWSTFDQRFREQPRHGADVAALLKEVAQRHGVEDWTFVGTSEGSVSAFHAARMNPGACAPPDSDRIAVPGHPKRPGLPRVAWEGLSARILWVHHEDDPCTYTAYRDALRFAEKSRSPLVTVCGGDPGRGDACEAFTAHGFVGIERETVTAMRSCMKTGVVPATVTRSPANPP